MSTKPYAAGFGFRPPRTPVLSVTRDAGRMLRCVAGGLPSKKKHDAKRDAAVWVSTDIYRPAC